MNTEGPELSGVTDPYLNWKAASKGRQRAVRRPRTSFNTARQPRTSFDLVIGKKPITKSLKESEDIIGKGPKRIGGNRKKSTTKSTKGNEALVDKGPNRTGVNRKKSTAKSSKESQDLIDKEPKRVGGVPVSESEKLGVSILGRRFSDTLEFVPIKKRRVHLASASLPPQLLSHLDGSDNQTEFGQERFTADGNTNLKEIKEGLCEDPDFSGISLLAAAACDSTITDDSMNAEGSVSKRHSSEGDEISWSAESHSLSEVKEEQLFNTSGDLDVKTDTVSSLDNVQNRGSKVEASSRNNKFNWDLNTTMESWESPFDEDVKAKPPAANVIVEHGICDEKMVNAEPCQGQVGLVDAKHAHELLYSNFDLSRTVADELFVSMPQFSCVPKDNHASEGSKVPEKPIFSCNSPVADHCKEKECLPISRVDGSSPKERQLEDTLIVKIDVAEETELLHCPSPPAGGALVLKRCSSLVNTSTLQEEKADAYPVCMGMTVETETRSSHLIPSENASTDSTTHTSESLPGMDQRTTAVIPEENKSAISVADLDMHTGGCHLTKVETEAENNASLRIDSEICKIDQRSTFSHLAEEASDVLLERTSVCQILGHADGMSGEVSHIDALDNSVRDHDDNSKPEMNSCLSDSHPFTCQGSSNHDELSSRSLSTAGHVTPTVNMKMKNNNCSVLADENLNTTKSDGPVHIGSNVSICDLAGTVPGMADAPPIDGALSSHETCRSYVDSFANSPGEVALGDHADCGYESHASQTGTDQAIGQEKVELMSDDDSQYEDGEFRGSIINIWGEDEVEDGETECVDYGSDNRDMDVEAAALHFDNVECKNMGLSEVGTANRDVAQERKVAEDAVSQPFLQGPLITDVWDTRCGKRSAGKLIKNGDGIKKYTEFSKGSDGARESFHSSSLRSKSSGCNKWPEGCRGSGDRIMDSGVDPANKKQTAATLNSSNVGESLRRAVGSTSREFLSSRIERPKSSEASNRKDRYYVKASSSGEANEQNFKFGGDVNNGRSFRRGRPSLHMHSRGPGDHWVDSRNHWNPESRDSPGYYGPPSFTHPGSKNAVAAVAAKLESNGFVIAPDGTILKAGGARPPGHVQRRSANASSQRTCHSVRRRRSPIEREGAFGMQHGHENPREMSPDRHINVSRGRTGIYDNGAVRTRHREKYRAPVPYHEPLCRRERSFSPHRRPLHPSRSHTRSPSRSRTRSPMWTPPRESSDRGMDRSPALRRRSRSPYFKSEVMQERMRSRMRERRSLHRRPDFKHMVGYAPSARNHTSPSHASRQTDERNESPNRFREYEYRRSSGRRLHARGFSQDHMFDLMDSLERSKPDECHRPMRCGRFPDSVSVGRGPRHDRPGNQRKGHGDGYGMLHLVRQHDIDGNMKHLHYDVEDGPRAHNPRSKISSEFQRRGSPAGFDRSIGSQLRDSPQRATEGKDVGYGRDGKNTANFKSFGIQDCDDDMTTHSRPS